MTNKTLRYSSNKYWNILIGSISCLLPLGNIHAQWNPIKGPLTGNITCSWRTVSSILVGTSDSGIYKSSDNGVSWRRLSIGLPQETMNTIAGNDSILFAGSDKGLYMSIDSGSTWAYRNTGPQDDRIFSILLHKSNVYCGKLQGIYRSSDGGTEWIEVLATKSKVSTLLSIDSLIVAGTQGHGIYLSSNSGTNWVLKDSFINVGGILSGIVADSNIYLLSDRSTSRLLRSVDFGNSWQNINPSYSGFIISIASKESVLYAASEHGLYTSTDYGVEWTDIRSTYPSAFTSTLIANDSFLFAGFPGGGIFRSSAPKETWSQIGLYPSQVNILQPIGTKLLTESIGSILLSLDTGDLWVAPSRSPRNINCIIQNGPTLLAGSRTNGLSVSIDSGITWQHLDTNIVDYEISALAIIDGAVLAGTTYSGVKQYNLDGTILSRSFTTKRVNALAVNDSTVYVATNEGIFNSSDNGEQWSLLAKPNQEIPFIGIFDNAIFATSDNRFLYTSYDGGLTWKSSDLASKVSSLAGNKRGVYAATLGRGVLYSSDKGLTWNEINGGLLDSNVYILKTNGTRLFAGTEHGIFVADIVDTTSRVKWRKEEEEEVNLLVFPNPASAFLNVNFNIEDLSNPELNLFDLLGNEVTLSTKITTSKNGFKLDIRNLVPGVYMVTLRSGQLSYVKSISIIK
jgi:photosystem II stability/assembly factor-like uncharacterized protein